MNPISGAEHYIPECQDRKLLVRETLNSTPAEWVVTVKKKKIS